MQQLPWSHALHLYFLPLLASEANNLISCFEFRFFPNRVVTLLEAKTGSEGALIVSGWGKFHTTQLIPSLIFVNSLLNSRSSWAIRGLSLAQSQLNRTSWYFREVNPVHYSPAFAGKQDYSIIYRSWVRDIINCLVIELYRFSNYWFVEVWINDTDITNRLFCVCLFWL